MCLTKEPKDHAEFARDVSTLAQRMGAHGALIVLYDERDSETFHVGPSLVPGSTGEFMSEKFFPLVETVLNCYFGNHRPGKPIPPKGTSGDQMRKLRDILDLPRSKDVTPQDVALALVNHPELGKDISPGAREQMIRSAERLMVGDFDGARSPEGLTPELTDEIYGVINRAIDYAQAELDKEKGQLHLNVGVPPGMDIPKELLDAIDADPDSLKVSFVSPTPTGTDLPDPDTSLSEQYPELRAAIEHRRDGDFHRAFDALLQDVGIPEAVRIAKGIAVEHDTEKGLIRPELTSPFSMPDSGPAQQSAPDQEETKHAEGNGLQGPGSGGSTPDLDPDGQEGNVRNAQGGQLQLDSDEQRDAVRLGEHSAE